MAHRLPELRVGRYSHRFIYSFISFFLRTLIYWFNSILSVDVLPGHWNVKESVKRNKEMKISVCLHLGLPMPPLLSPTVPLTKSCCFESRLLTLLAGTFYAPGKCRCLARSAVEEDSFLHQYKALELVSVFSGKPLMSMEHGERYSWQPVLLGRWVIYCVLFLSQCSQRSWLHF